VNLMGLKPNPLDLSSYSALTLLVGSFDPQKPVSDMTYDVFGKTLNLFAQLQLSSHLSPVMLTTFGSCESAVSPKKWIHRDRSIHHRCFTYDCITFADILLFRVTNKCVRHLACSVHLKRFVGLGVGVTCYIT